MAFGATCDCCGCDLLGLDIRYKAALDISQAYDPMEISNTDLRRDLRGELESLVAAMEAMPQKQVQKVEEEVHSAFCFDLCPACAAHLRENAKALFQARRGPLREPSES